MIPAVKKTSHLEIRRLLSAKALSKYALSLNDQFYKTDRLLIVEVRFKTFGINKLKLELQTTLRSVNSERNESTVVCSSAFRLPSKRTDRAVF